MDEERRRHRRKDALKFGTLSPATNGPDIDCLVWNVSVAGGMVEVEPGIRVPAVGRLKADSLSIDRAYRLVWTEGRKNGIAFIG